MATLADMSRLVLPEAPDGTTERARKSAEGPALGAHHPTPVLVGGDEPHGQAAVPGRQLSGAPSSGRGYGPHHVTATIGDATPPCRRRHDTTEAGLSRFPRPPPAKPFAMRSG